MCGRIRKQPQIRRVNEDLTPSIAVLDEWSNPHSVFFAEGSPFCRTPCS
ncbi:hypothetical protein GCK32_017935 [Trichostrongylus colubriformis]|uniref:Uncharacterized protein n=1 Tax=Trichostrongylus colubriformis TaxID=6319 RepID=A0AAN8G2C7_TRICO